MFRRFFLPLVGLLTLTLTLAISASGYGATPSCDLYASPTGSDSAGGSIDAPLRSVQRLADSLSTGQVGCLRAGSYEGSGDPGDPYRELKITRPGITLTSASGEQAEIDARVWIARGADGVTISDLLLDGANTRDLPSPTVNADRAVFRHDDVTNRHTSICFVIGNSVWGRSRGTLIENSRIHGCGETPSTNQEHGIYLSAAADTRDPRQLDLRQHGSRHPALPGCPGDRDHRERDLRERRRDHLLRRRWGCCQRDPGYRQRDRRLPDPPQR